MGNTQTNEKQSKSGKSPAKSRNFIRNLNRKSPGRDSKKQRKKAEAQSIDKELDKVLDSNDAIDTFDTEGKESDAGAGRCAGSATGGACAGGSSCASTDSVAAVELNHAYYSAESDSHHTHTRTPSDIMPDNEKEEKIDTSDDSDRNDEKVMGAVFSKRNEDQHHDTGHEFRENRLKSSPGHTSFTLSKHRKVEVPPVACEPALTLLDNVLNEAARRPCADVGTEAAAPASIPDSNVLRKVASLTLDKHHEPRILRPKFVPEKLDFQLYEKFEGQMLLNWFLSSIGENNYMKNLLKTQDLKNVLIQYCTHLLAAGVLRQIPDKDAPTESIFKPNLMYYWAHMVAPMTQPVTPGRLMSAWPPKDSYCSNIEHITTTFLENNHNIQNNNEEFNDITEAKSLIADLKRKLQDLELEVEKLKTEGVYKNLERNFEPQNNLLYRRKVELVTREVQTLDFEANALDYKKSVINLPDIRTNVDNETLELSSVKNLTEDRSDKVENYCKLNKSRDLAKKLETDTPNTENLCELVTKEVTDNVIVSRPAKSEHTYYTAICESVSSSSFCTALEANVVSDLRKSSCSNAKPDIPGTQVLYSQEDKNFTESSGNSETSSVDMTNVSYMTNNQGNKTCPSTDSTTVEKSQEKSSPPPPLPGASPPPPPTPGTICTSRPEEDKEQKNASQTSGIECSTQNCPLMVTNDTQTTEISKINTATSPMLGISKNKPELCETAMQTSTKICVDMGVSPPASYPKPLTSTPLPPPMPDLGPPPPPMPHMGPPPPPMLSIDPPPPPILHMGPPPPPMPDMGPPPPPMPDIGPPPPPMPDMGPPPPPMPDMGPPPPPMPGLGPPPPPMPGFGPPPPPMPGMTPPPPPMPGMTPPPPPMPGMTPPPPPMPGMTPPPPPSMGPNTMPPPMPGMAPPPPPGAAGMMGHSGPVPFPAPPVGGWNVQRATLRKTPVKPVAPMKPLYWTRILAPPPPALPACQGDPTAANNAIVKPLWLEIEEAKLDNIDEFADLFSRQVVKAPVKKKVEVKTKIQPIKILDSKRSQNVGILAQSLHVEFSEIENAIYNFDTSVVSIEALQQIYELRATPEELSLIKEHIKNKPDIPLDKPEAFLHDLSGIPNFAERISCFMFQADFEDAISTIMHKLDNLKHTCEFLMTSESLKKLFAIILTLGNYMNGGNGQRGQADGFGLEILSRLKDVKSKQSNITLLHFIVRTYMRGCGGALSDECALPVPEPGDVARAAAIDFGDVRHQLDALQAQLTACKEKTKIVIEHNDARISNETNGDGKKRLDAFKDKMTSFIQAAEEKLKSENENLEECHSKFILAMEFYQFNIKSGKLDETEPKEFFGLWTSFCSDFKDIYKKEEQIAIKEKLKETKKLQYERKIVTQPKKEGGLKARLQKLSNSRK